MNYKEADSLLQGRCRERRKLENNTYLERHEDCIAVRLHNTNVVTFYPNGRVDVSTGGWNTVTTKDRINRYLPGPYHTWSDAKRYGGVAVIGNGWQARAVVPCTIPASGKFTRKDTAELARIEKETRQHNRERARARYREIFWIRKARVGGKLRKPLTLDMVKAEQNASVKAAMLKLYGFERFFTQVQAETLDTRGEYRLISYPLNNWQNVRALKMVCPSTNLVHIHAVPPNTASIAEALDWMFQTENYTERLQAEA